MIVSLKNNKEIIIPDLFQEFISDSSSFKICSAKDIQNLNKISKDIKNDKFIIIEKSTFSNISKLYDFVNKKIDEFIPHELKNQLRSKVNTRNKKSVYESKKKDILDHILILCRNDQCISFEDRDIPNLIYFCGSNFKYTDQIFMVPFRFYTDLEKKLKKFIHVEAAGVDFRTGINVLLPKSQETYRLFRKSIVDISERNNLNILDMGCGSGVISYIIDELVDNCSINLTDILPESIGSALLNLEKKIRVGGTNTFTALTPGSLYDNIDKKFDLIIFNPPWIDAISSNRSELALNDKDQSTVKEFLSCSREYLNKNGKILIGFSDNSGDKAVEKFEESIRANSYSIVKINSDRIQSYQSGRKWMKIFVYELKLN